MDGVEVTLAWVAAKGQENGAGICPTVTSGYQFREVFRLHRDDSDDASAMPWEHEMWLLVISPTGTHYFDEIHYQSRHQHPFWRMDNSSLKSGR